MTSRWVLSLRPIFGFCVAAGLFLRNLAVCYGDGIVIVDYSSPSLLLVQIKMKTNCKLALVELNN